MNIDQNQVWADCLSYMSRRVNKQSFFTWLKPTIALGSDNGSFQIGVPNKFVADWLEEHYNDLITDALRSVTSDDCSYSLVVKPPNTQQQTEIFAPSSNPQPSANVFSSLPSKPVRIMVDNGLSNRYRFDDFVVGDSNEFAYAACMAVAESPRDNKYNPLFIYGGVGLGKTHLVQAIGNYTIENTPNSKVLYVTSEKFTNEFIESITARSATDFAARYRSVDMLLIDDIQFFTGKESTQEQFFHTFNALHQNNKQIVLTADRPPRDIRGLEERLLSRFSWGLVTDIQPPSLETRIAILQKKSQSEGVSLPVDVLTFIADTVTTNIRALEGSLTRVLAYASLRGKEITVDVANHVLKDTISTAKQTLTTETIQKRVSQSCGIPPEMMQAKKKTAEVVLARQIAMYLCRMLTDSSLKAIGAAFGGRDHSTVIHAKKTIETLMKKDVKLKLRIDQLIDSMYVQNP